MTKYRARLNVGRHHAYRIGWHSEKPFENYRPKVSDIGFFDDDEVMYEEGMIVPLTKAAIAFFVQPVGENNTYDIFFSGIIEFELDPEQERILEKDYLFDYNLTFSGPDGEVLSCGDDEMSVEAHDEIFLEDLEALSEAAGH
jgi:hypothetical protein